MGDPCDTPRREIIRRGMIYMPVFTQPVSPRLQSRTIETHAECSRQLPTEHEWSNDEAKRYKELESLRRPQFDTDAVPMFPSTSRHYGAPPRNCGLFVGRLAIPRRYKSTCRCPPGNE